LVIKRFWIIVAVCALVCAFTPAQDNADKIKLIKEFTLSAEMDGIILNFVVLNNKTVDALFSGSGKYAIRARANASTIFYVQGVPEKDIKLAPSYRVEQNGSVVAAKSVNIKNFKEGKVEKGTKIEGLVELPKKIDLHRQFRIINISQNVSAEFKLSPEAIQLMEN
jgi:hypothetical protein